jgi:hypothetical protein
MFDNWTEAAPRRRELIERALRRAGTPEPRLARRRSVPRWE